MELTGIDRLVLALALGLLVGFQRQWAAKRLAGIRTFPMITAFGMLAAALARDFGGWVLAGGLVALAAVLWAGNTGPDDETGITTEVSVLVMFAVGALVAQGAFALAVVTTGAVAVLLHWKRPLHEFVGRVGEEDLRSVMRLVLIGLVILPALPNESFGPYQVLNPFQIWLMVVLIVGLSLGGYLAHRLAGDRVGALLAGVLGGLISSTATTVSQARASRQAPGQVPSALLVIVVASTVVFLRVFVLAGIVAPSVLRALIPPLLAMFGLMALLSLIAFGITRRRLGEATLEHAPSDMRAAVAFGALYAVVLLAVAVARQHFGLEGLYPVAALSGLTDVDAITLSTVQLIHTGRLEPELGWRLILIGALANLVFKGAAAVALGNPKLRPSLLTLFGAALAGGVTLLLVWP